MIIGALSMHDIKMALETKKELSYEDVRKGLSPEARQYTSLFVDDKLSLNTALPHPHIGLD